MLLALALPRHAPHQPPRAAPSFLLRRRFARRRLRDGWRAAAARQLDRFFFFDGLPRVLDLFWRAGAVLEQLLGDLFGLLLVADDLRAAASLYCVCSMALRVALSGCEGWGESAPGPTSAAAARPIKSSKKRIFGLPEALGIALQAAHAELLRNSSKSI